MAEERTAWEPTDEDFEAWDGAKDEEAFSALSGFYRPRHVIGDGHYFGKTPSGGVYRMPLGISIATFEALTSDTNVETIGALKGLLEEFAPGQVDRLEREPIQAVQSLLEDYLSCVVRAQGASLGESRTSPER